MLSTFDHEVLTRQHHEDRLAAFARRRMIALATEDGRVGGVIATIVARLRGTTSAPRIASVNTSRA